MRRATALAHMSSGDSSLQGSKDEDEDLLLDVGYILEAESIGLTGGWDREPCFSIAEFYIGIDMFVCLFVHFDEGQQESYLGHFHFEQSIQTSKQIVWKYAF